MMRFLPMAVFAVLVGFFAYRLVMIEAGHAPDAIPSVMIDQPAPEFVLPSLMEGKPNVTSSMFAGHVTFLSIFASWCVPCLQEHPLLEQLKMQGVTLIGINYKDDPQYARQWLAQHGNPYDMVGMDREGKVAMEFGVYGVPESYVIDAQGKIRWKYTGPLTQAMIQDVLLPMLKELRP